MAQPLESTDYIPQVDAPLDPQTRAALLAQVHAERPSDVSSRLHPLINTSYTPTFTPSLTLEHDRIASGAKKEPGTGIDLSRYEADALEAPSETSTANSAAWKATLQRAYASSTYLNNRTTALSLLETYGKNAWLVGNWHAESEVKLLEEELKAVKQQTELLQEERRRRQEAVAAELALLENGWRKAIGGLVEVQVASEGLRGEVLEKRTRLAAGN